MRVVFLDGLSFADLAWAF